MQYPLSNLLRSALVEVVGAQVPAATPTHIHPLLVPVAAVRAFPDELPIVLHDLDFAIIAADLTVITLGGTNFGTMVFRGPQQTNNTRE
jgi:hypothetical protein